MLLRHPARERRCLPNAVWRFVSPRVCLLLGRSLIGRSLVWRRNRTLGDTQRYITGEYVLLLSMKRERDLVLERVVPSVTARVPSAV